MGAELIFFTERRRRMVVKPRLHFIFTLKGEKTREERYWELAKDLYVRKDNNNDLKYF